MQRTKVVSTRIAPDILQQGLEEICKENSCPPEEIGTIANLIKTLVYHGVAALTKKSKPTTQELAYSTRNFLETKFHIFIDPKIKLPTLEANQVKREFPEIPEPDRTKCINMKAIIDQGFITLEDNLNSEKPEVSRIAKLLQDNLI